MINVCVIVVYLTQKVSPFAKTNRIKIHELAE